MTADVGDEVDGILGRAGRQASCAGVPTETRRSTTYDGGVTAVVVETDDHDVRVVGSEQRDVRVDRTLRHSGGDEPERIDRRNDGTLVVAARCSARFVLVGDACGGTYDVRVPHATRVRNRRRHGGGHPWRCGAAQR